ncbi:MAG: glycosyltransferase family 4 protein [candidate division WWE3 bacterium]|nr:glycosyltransferase family 4 protein [candidate division WWE3 bacterium]
MKVLMQSRYDILTKQGGDTVQLLETQKALQKLGVEVDINCAANFDLAGYDLVHLFNLDWVRETYRQAKNAVAQNVPYVLSPIHHKYSDIKIWEDSDRYDFKRVIYPIFKSYSSREFVKSFYKALVNPVEIPDFITQLPISTTAAQKWVVAHSSYLLPNALGERDAIKEDLGIEFKSDVVPNGVSPVFYNADSSSFIKEYGQFPFILCVGRLESRKNQLRVIEAVKILRQIDPALRLVLVGSYNPHHFEYSRLVKRALLENPWIVHIDQLPYLSMPAVFAAAKTHVSASWKETTGLVNLEAALAGCGVVAPRKGYCEEYLGENGEYCDPANIASIVSAITASFTHKPSEDFKQMILRDFTWEQTAKKTLAVYNSIS